MMTQSRRVGKREVLRKSSAGQAKAIYSAAKLPEAGHSAELKTVSQRVVRRRWRCSKGSPPKLPVRQRI
jgi:hypothetical protein